MQGEPAGLRPRDQAKRPEKGVQRRDRCSEPALPAGSGVQVRAGAGRSAQPLGQQVTTPRGARGCGCSLGLSRCAAALGGVMIENPWQPTRWPTPAGAQAKAGRGWEAGLWDTWHIPWREAGPLSWAGDRPRQVSLSTPKDRNSPARLAQARGGTARWGVRLLWGRPSTQHGPGGNERPCRAVWGGSRAPARAAVGPLSPRGSLPSARRCPPITGSPSIQGSPGQ